MTAFNAGYPDFLSASLPPSPLPPGGKVGIPRKKMHARKVH